MNKQFLNNFGEHLRPSGKLPVAYIVTSSIEHADDQDILFLSLWGQRNKKKKADFKIYLYKNGYMSQKLVDGVYIWSTACLDNLIGYWYSSNNKISCDMLQDKERIETFFNTKLKVCEEYYIINTFQKKLMNKKLATKHKKITDKIDEAMLKVSPLPKDFDNWVYNGPFDFSRYIYYKREGNKINAFCTECKEEFIIQETKLTHKNIKNNKSGTCPMCKKKITYKPSGKTTQLEDRTQFAIMQKYEDSFIVRYFSGTKTYKNHYKKPSVHYHETIREIYKPYNNSLITKKYEYAEFMQTGNFRWCDDTGKRGVPKAYFYTKNLNSILKDTKWKYSCMYDYAKEVKFLYADVFLSEYIKHPAIEYFIKFKLYKFVDDNLGRFGYGWSDINFKGKKIKDIFGVDNHLFQQMQRLNLGINGLSLIKEIGVKGGKIEDKQVKWLCENFDSFGHLYKLLGFTTVNKIIKYVKSQASNKYNLKNVMIDWCDYIRQCKELKFDLNNTFILYPRDLKAKHEEYSMMCDTKKLEKFNSKIKKVFEDLNEKYSYSDNKNFIIRPVTNVSEVVTEGHKQRHCIASMGYVEAMSKGNIAIMVLRKIDEPNNPFYTLELNLRNLEIVQCRGYRNCDMTQEVKKFTTSWENKILTKNKDKSKTKVSA